jgi:glycerophosphoryl diester phosphodiesterase
VRGWLVLSLALAACSDESSAPSPADTELTPGAFLPPSAYDCTAGSVVAPARAHGVGCFADAACDAPLVAGHRMATPFAPENSLSALRAAILLGVDIVETDVRMTSDGHVVLLHDGSVDRTLEGTGDVDALTLAEIQAMPMKAAGKPPGDFSCDHVPTLDEVFAISVGQIIVELEVKDTAAGVATAEYIRDHDLAGAAFMLCSASECDALRAAVPDVPIMSRPEAPDEVPAAIAYAPPPILVHIDYTAGFLADEVLDPVRALPAKVYGNAFVVADIEAVSSGRLQAYQDMFDGGLDVVQTELPHLALVGIGRLQPPGAARPN